MTRLCSVITVAALLAACGGESGADAGPETDAATADGGRSTDGGSDGDGGSEDDAGTPDDDGGTGDDAGTPSDGGSADDAGTTGDAGIDGGLDCGTFGQPCTGSGTCGDEYTCDVTYNRCLPTGRPICGGIAGASCPSGGTHTQCVYPSGSSGGLCLTRAEELCACMRFPTFFSCS